MVGVLEGPRRHGEAWTHGHRRAHGVGADRCGQVALLFEQGHIEEAEEVYRADIKLWKDNMWGLLGLKLCLEARGDAPEELAAVTALFEERSSRADIVPAKTCFCAQDALDTSCCS